MKVVILAGGEGKRFPGEISSRPKPMVEIGGKPLLWHIVNIYAASGYKEFLVACGYKGEMIKEYFHDIFIHNNDYVIDLKKGTRKVLNSNGIDWKIGVIDTGSDTQTGGRILRLRKWIGEDTFMVTYGDRLADVDIRALLAFHRAHGKLATVTAVHPPSQFGALVITGDEVIREFSEKPQAGEGWINGGFFVFEPAVFDRLSGDDTVLEREPLAGLLADKQLMAFRHEGFWQRVDTFDDKERLESLWASGNPPWYSSGKPSKTLSVVNGNAAVQST
jgi:glucose-1-phosphate cytidylyltransferase